MNFLAPKEETLDEKEAKIPFSVIKYPRKDYSVYWEIFQTELPEEKLFRAEIRLIGYADFEYRETKVITNKSEESLNKEVQKFLEAKMPTFRRA